MKQQRKSIGTERKLSAVSFKNNILEVSGFGGLKESRRENPFPILPLLQKDQKKKSLESITSSLWISLEVGGGGGISIVIYCSCVQKTILHSTADSETIRSSKTTRLNKSEYFRVFFWWEIENV